jgi:hypothetical protein
LSVYCNGDCTLLLKELLKLQLLDQVDQTDQ